ncbi:MAG: type VI secretion system contractile sheath large subunit [Phycisphaerae bacterium]
MSESAHIGKADENMAHDEDAAINRVADNLDSTEPSSLAVEDLDNSAAPQTPSTDFLAEFIATENPRDAIGVWLRGMGRTEKPATVRLLVRTLNQDIARIDQLLTEQVNAIIHHPTFQKLEASWRGLSYMVRQAGEDEHSDVKIKVLNASWSELQRDVRRSNNTFDATTLFRLVYEGEFGLAGGQPFGALIGDYEICHKPSSEHPTNDLEILESIAQVAAASFAPFITGTSPELLGLDHYGQLERGIDIDQLFRGPDYVAWRRFRESPDAQFVGLVLPHVLMRNPYKKRSVSVRRHRCVDCKYSLPTDSVSQCPACGVSLARRSGKGIATEYLGFCFEEDVSGPTAERYLWGNAAYAFGAVLIRSFQDCAWFADIRGFNRDLAEGGLVTGLPVEHFGTDSFGVAPKMSVDVAISDMSEKDFGAAGLIPLSHCHDTEFCAFFSNWSVHQPKKYDEASATLNARISAMLQYVMCVSRFAHYLKVQMRDRVGSSSEALELQDRLTNWIYDYVTTDDHASPETKAKYPLQKAAVEVTPLPGAPGKYQCTMQLWPHYQLDELRMSVQMKTKLL